MNHNKTLRVDFATETTQWDPQRHRRSGWVVFNLNTEENNRNAQGMFVGDYLPDFKAGHRIVPSSESLVNAKITVSRLKKGRHSKVAGQWKLYFPRNIKIWRESGAGQWREIRSGTPYALPDSLFVAFKIEGVIPSEKPDDLRLSADFTLQGRTKPLRSTQVFMVTSGQLYLEENNPPEDSVPDWTPRPLPTPVPTPLNAD